MATLNINYSYVNAGEAPGSEFDSERSDYGDGEAEDIEEVEEEYADTEEEYYISVSEQTEEVRSLEELKLSRRHKYKRFVTENER